MGYLFLNQMNLFGKIQSQYESLWKQVIRPPRTHYSEEELGPSKFTLEGINVERKDFQMVSMRECKFQCSLWFPAKMTSFSCVIYLHGSTGNRTEGMQFLGKLIKNQIGLCTFDFCGCGNAQGDYITMGYYQQHDVHQVLDFLREMKMIKDIAFWGRQMGAVSALLCLSKTLDVKAAILDSPFKSLKSFVEEALKKYSKVPSMLVNGAIKMISKTIEQKADFDIANVNPYKFSAPGLYIPALFVFNSNEEGEIGEKNKALFDAYGGLSKQLFKVVGKQNESRNQQCVQSCLAFLNANLAEMNQSFKESVSKQFDFFQDKIQMNNSNELGQKKSKKQEEKAAAENVSTKKTEEFSFKNILTMFLGDSQKEKENPRKGYPKEDIDDGYNEFRLRLVNTDKQSAMKENQWLKKFKSELDSSWEKQNISLKKWALVSTE